MGKSRSKQGEVEAFIKRWTDRKGGAERANYALFLVGLCDLIKRRAARSRRRRDGTQ